MTRISYEDLFKTATGFDPFPYQKSLSEDGFPDLIKVPTGAGKTASVVLSWLWKRKFSSERDCMPRRLVYCLPMRVLVEQTVDTVERWICNLRTKYPDTFSDGPKIYTLLGGEAEDDWDRYPEQEAILIGTQDMLMSRALNRGYALSRFRWPIDFGLLNNDSLWVMDEIQLMGATLPNSVQLDAFRKQYNGSSIPHGTVWMSATCEADWLKTVDKRDAPKMIKLSGSDLSNKTIKKRVEAVKKLNVPDIVLETPSKANIKTYVDLVKEAVLEKHEGLTLVILNTVNRARELYESIKEVVPDRGELLEREKLLRKMIDDPGSWARKKQNGDLYASDEKKLEKFKEELNKIRDNLRENIPDVILIHSRFRPTEREKLNEKISSLTQGELPEGGAIVISTQVIEAGVDISADNMFTEIAPWTSLVQRFGRLNRYGDLKESSVTVFGLSTEGQTADKLALPYTVEDLEKTRNYLDALEEVSIESIDAVEISPPSESHMVLRRKDLMDLFDTTPDLSGNDIDVSQYIRDVNNRDVYAFWKEFDQENLNDVDFPLKEEICSVPLESMRDFLNKSKKEGYLWDHLEGEWVRARPENIVPGQYVLLSPGQGGYSPRTGWDPGLKERVEPISLKNERVPPEATGDDKYVTARRWQTLGEHTEAVISSLGDKTRDLPIGSELKEALTKAAWFHDTGKAHPVFQKAITSIDGCPSIQEIWSKSGSGGTLRYERKYFRHELASALVMLQNPALVGDDIDLIVYLAGAHHGKVRLSIRSLPQEDLPWEIGDFKEGTRFARGIWEGDELPTIELPGGINIPATKIDLTPMEMGSVKQIPWTERMIRLRDEHGPFLLGYLEGILRTADWEASSGGGV